ncbi:MAG TPA: ArsC family (seleno)protein [Gemmataceae bacterium]|nr:ArsC family (seleno)protein [Gemmataceae bacterium]
MSCKKAQGFLERHDVDVKTVVDANKQKQGRTEALALAKTANVIHIAKGKKIVTFDMVKNPPDDDALVEQMLGPTGNLRAPTIKKGKTLYVGFNADAYAGLIR